MAISTVTSNNPQASPKSEAVTTSPEVADTSTASSPAHVTTTVSTHKSGPSAAPPGQNRANVNNFGGMQQTREIAAIVRFPTPVPLTVSYPKTWGTQDFSLMTQFLAESYGIISDGYQSGDATAIFNSAKSKAALAIKRKIQNMTGATHSAGFLNVNQTELLFQGIDFREINLSHTFAPNSEQELTEALKLIAIYKKYSAPKKAGEYRLQYPALFELDFSLKDGGHIFKTKPVALTNITVNYTPQELWNTFKNGHPTMFTMECSFKEVELLTQDDFDENAPYDNH